MGAKKKILFFPFPLLSHYLRCLQLAETVKNDFDVMFPASAIYNKWVEQFGFTTFACENFDAPKVMHDARRFDFSWLNESDLERIFLSQLGAIEQYEPALIIGDAAPTLKMAAAKTGVAFLSLLNGYFTRHYACTRSISRAHYMYPYLQIMPAGIKNKLIGWGEQNTFYNIHKPFKKLRQKYNLPTEINYQHELEGDITIICDLHDLFPQKRLPANYTIIGPLFYKTKEAEEEVLNFIRNDKKTILVSMGSSGDWGKMKFLQHDYFKQFNIVTAGLDKPPIEGKNIINKKFLNASAIMPYVSVTACHGGNGTIYQSLADGVPPLCFTSHFEQEWNANRLQELGLGASLDKVTSTKQIINEVEKWVQRSQNGQLTDIAEKISPELTQQKFRQVIDIYL